MFLIIYDQATMLVHAVYGKALREEAEAKLDECNGEACGTSSSFRLTESTTQWSVGEEIKLEPGNYVLILLNPDDRFVHRAVGPFEYEDSPERWMEEQGIANDAPFKIMTLEPHGWDS